MAYGDGKSIIEILNIGFEPLLTEEEYSIFKEIGKITHDIYMCKRQIKFINNKLLYLDSGDTYYEWLLSHLFNFESKLFKSKELFSEKNKEFKTKLKNNITTTRRLFDNREWSREEQFRNINIFESDLTRAFDCQDMVHSDDIISVVTYYTEIFNSIIHNGFIYKDRKYVFFTAGAGQTRNKKSTFVAEDKLDQHFNRFFCGLSREVINQQGGMNTNKFLAYTSLCQSNTSIWSDFDIDKAIVVPDIEFVIPEQKVRHIYTETPEDKERIKELKNEILLISEDLRKIKEEKKQNPKGYRRPKEEIEYEKQLKFKKKELQQEIKDVQSKYHTTEIKKMDVVIPFTDGFGITFKKEPNAMVRMPFMKGLLSYISRNKYKKYCKENGLVINQITDIYGVSHKIDDVDILFTESQFKMHKYYKNQYDDNGNLVKSGWDLYKEYFKEYGCTANRCNIEKKYMPLNAKTNYQVLQTLTTEMTDDEIVKLSEYDINNLNGIGKDLKCMFNILGADPDRNNNMNYFQKSLLLYPEMFKDYYVKTLLQNTKASMLKKIKSGKFNIDGVYTFIVPEPLACLQWWFNGERDLDKLGLIREGQVYCRLFDDDIEVDCLRSPHLDHAHCIRKNLNTKELRTWYRSNALYVGVKDIMSKLLMYDNDGDISLVHKNPVIIDCAKRYQEKYEMIPNYYDMPKANPEMLTDDSLFNGIVMAYHHGNIGTPSNEITKVFDTLSPKSNREEVEEAIEVVALRCCDVNYTIDYAKTLYKPTIPKDVIQRYKYYSKRKVPNFFMFAKDKRKDQVEEVTKNNINRIATVVKPGRIKFSDENLLGKSKFSYKTMMANPDIKYSKEQADKILELYREVENAKIRQLKRMDFEACDIREKQKIKMFLEKNGILQGETFSKMLGLDKEFICDILIKLLQNDANKDTLWKMFGDIIYGNLKNNLNGTKRCEKCGIRFEIKSKSDHSSKYCSECSRIVKNEQNKSYYKK